jgi:hypothetical protein
MYTLELTEEEIEFVYTRCLRKAMRLEESHLEDVPCYQLANQIMSKIYDSKKAVETEMLPDNMLEVSRLTYENLKESGQLNPNIIYVRKM